MGINSIPAELKALYQWVVCKGKDKKPYNARTFDLASTSDSPTWSPYEDAIAAVKDGKASGVGFVFTIDDGLCGIDLDGVIDDSGNITSEAQEIVDRLDSYTEVSRGKHGLHVIVRAKKPTSRCRKDWVEIYETGRYFIITGKVWRSRKVINERQEALDWLCSDVFGTTETTEAEPVAVDVVLDRDAKPPSDKLDLLLKDRLFLRTWNHKREDFGSLSEYDLSLAGFAIRSGWTDQEAYSLMVAFRRRWGDDDNLEKALRPDYVKRTLAKVKPEADTTDVLDLLPFKVVRVEQRGIGESTPVILHLDSSEKIEFDTTEMLLSKTRARARLWQYNYDLPKKAEDSWREITKALIALKERTPVVTREESMRSALQDYVGSKISLPKIERDGSLSDMFGSGLNSIAKDEEGRIYLRLSDFARYVRVHTGMGGVTQKKVANDLIDLGFKKKDKVHIMEDGKERQINLWVSPPGLAEGVVD